MPATSLCMEGAYRERWQQLCILVADEKDPVRFQQLCQELLMELEKKDERLKSAAKTRLSIVREHLTKAGTDGCSDNDRE